MANNYNKTLNLPQTDFPMRAGLPKREPEILDRWNRENLYQELLKKNEGKPLFALHDGPPFSNGNIHMGTAMNKALKDIIVRSYAQRGYYTPYVPGWDNHGMPIESAIIRDRKLNHKTMNTADFRTACQKYAEKYVGLQMQSFRRIGVLGDWEHPYLTMSPSFEAEEVKVFGEMYKKGYIYKGFKPVYWCPRHSTALAEAEIEYKEDPCVTAYVKFRLRDDLGKLPHLEKNSLYVLIWTTTVWTLPGNLAIALSPTDSYAIVKNKDKDEMYLLAEALTEKVMAAGGVENYEIVETHPGAFFEYMLAEHPFLEKSSMLCTADYVTMDSGTGCVHTAPGFGVDDYNTCTRYGIELVVPVDDEGRHTEYAGKYAHLTTEESNPVILEDMRQSGALFASEEILHSYPHCWRCKGQIIFRATPQWFCSVEDFKEEACVACDEVRWVPSWGIDRMKSMIRERSDWCISRQRKWGLPIPVFYCPDCGEPVCTQESIDAVSDLFGREGSNAWFLKEASEILPEGFVCPHCQGKGPFTKEENTLDGWFDSGSSHVASQKKDQGFWPATMYLEGLDQFRGWFQSSLLTAVGALGKGSPFRECVTHGWTVDGEGRAMHKSLGNGMDPNDIIGKYGADILRLWAASADYHADVRCSDAIFRQLSQNYLKFRNTARYFLGNLGDFDPDQLTPPEETEELDRYILSRLNKLIERCFQAYDDYEFLTVTHAVNDFCVVELSNFYLDVVKDRLYCEGKTSRERRSAQTALFLLSDTLTKIMAPILCFTCDEIWQAMPHRSADDPRNVCFNDMNRPFEEYAAGVSPLWADLLTLREDVNAALEKARSEKKIGKSLEAEVTLCTGPEHGLTPLQEHFENQWADLFLVSRVNVSPSAEISTETSAEDGQGSGQGENSRIAGVRIRVSPAGGNKCPRCWKQVSETDADGLCPRCSKVLSFCN